MFEGFADWLARISWPLVTKVLSSLGVGTLTFVGADSALDNALGAAQGALNGMTGAALAIAVRAGLFDVFSIMSGGLTSALAWMVMKRWAIFTGEGNTSQAA